MATKEHWEIDPWNDEAVMNAVAGKCIIDPEELAKQLHWIFGGQAGSRCLEIGAGFGRLLPEACKYFTYAWGVDSSLSLVARSTHYLRHQMTAKVVLSDGMFFPFQDNFFDFVYSFTCFQHMPSFNEIFTNLCEARRVLKPEGACRIQTVKGNRDHAGRYDGYVFNSAEEFATALTEAGFQKVYTLEDGEWIWATGKKQ